MRKEKIRISLIFKDNEDWQFRIPKTNHWVRRRSPEWYMGLNGQTNVELTIDCTLSDSGFLTRHSEYNFYIKISHSHIVQCLSGQLNDLQFMFEGNPASGRKIHKSR